MPIEIESQRESLHETEKPDAPAADAIHRLNNLLNNISMSCQIAIDEMEDLCNPEFIRELLIDIEQEVQRASDTVQELRRHEDRKVDDQTGSTRHNK